MDARWGSPVGDQRKQQACRCQREAEGWGGLEKTSEMKL